MTITFNLTDHLAVLFHDIAYAVSQHDLSGRSRCDESIRGDAVLPSAAFRFCWSEACARVELDPSEHLV
jgi:hypothetical protein